MRTKLAMKLYIGLGLSLFFVTFTVNAQGNNIMQSNIREALVAPYLEQIEIKTSTNILGTEKPTYMKVWIMADDRNGSKIYFNQETKKFGLAKYTEGKNPFTSEDFGEHNELAKVFLNR